MISSAEQTISAIADTDSAAARIATLEAENSQLRAQPAWFKRQIFGRKSEKQIHCPAGSAGAETAGQPDALPRLVCAQPKR